MKKYIIAIFAAALLVSGCDTSEPDPMLYLLETSIELESNETEATFQIVSDEVWTVTSASPWLSFDQPEGTNSALITVTVEPNTFFDDRTAEIQIEGMSAGANLPLTQRAEQILIIRDGSLPEKLTAAGGTAVNLFSAQLNPNSTLTGEPTYAISDNNAYDWTVTQTPDPSGEIFSADIPANTAEEDITVTFELTARMTPVGASERTYTRSISFIQAGTGVAP